MSRVVFASLISIDYFLFIHSYIVTLELEGIWGNVCVQYKRE
jgi:hypothetical protein